jgi:D-glycero-alpha-D-manno-heptose 1-phosphate guanylyltransferase
MNVMADRPKALVEVRGRAFLEWILLGLRRDHRVQHAVLATGHLGGMIEEHLGREFCGIALTFSREDQPLGTGGALRLAATRTNSQRLLVLNGDTYCRFDMERLQNVQIRRSAAATLWLNAVEDGHRFGTVMIEPDGRILGFEEKAAKDGPRLASSGVCLIDRHIVNGIQIGRRISLEHDLFPSLVGRGLYGVIGSGDFIDIGTPKSLAMSGVALASEFEQLGCE